MFPTGRGHFAIHEIDPPKGVSPRGNVVLIPGFTGSKEDFLPLLPPLAAAGYRVRAMDQRGQFQTPGPEDPDAYAIAELGADALAVAADFAGPVHLVGHSFGGFPARAAAVSAGEVHGAPELASVTLLCSGPGPMTVEREVGRAGMLIAALENFSVEQVWSFVAGAAESAGEYEDVAPDVPQFLARRFLSSSHVGLATMAGHLLTAAGNLDELAETGLPVLVAHGTEDYIWLPEQQKDMATRLGARYVVIDGAAHSPAVENPQATAAVLVDFWGSVEQ
jgi:pimeloyl-ACP methyl ester carboxylesterase